MFGQQFVVENRVGAMGTLAADAVVRAPPDGYTLFWAGTGTVSIFPAMGKPPYDTFKDFAPISMIGTNPQVLIVNPKLPIKTVKEFVDYVKAQKEKLPYGGGGGPGSVSNLLMALFLKRAGLEMTVGELSRHGAGDDRRDRGPHPDHVRAAAGSKAAGRRRQDPHDRDFRRQAFAQRARHSDHRGIGLSRFPRHQLERPDGAGRQRPKDIVNRIAAEFAKAAKDPKFVAQLDTYGVEPFGLTPEEFTKFVKQDMALWAEAVKIAGVTLQ